MTAARGLVGCTPRLANHGWMVLRRDDGEATLRLRARIAIQGD